MDKPTYIVVDFETTCLKVQEGRELHGLSVTLPDGTSRYWRATEVPQKIKDLIADESVTKVAHRMRFDQDCVRQMGLPIAGEWLCTKLLAQEVDENEDTGLKDIIAKRRGEGHLEQKTDIDKKVAALGGSHVGDLCKQDNDSPGAYYDVIARYAVEDGVNTNWVFKTLISEVRQWQEKAQALGFTKGPLDHYKEVVLPVEPVLQYMQDRGIRIDVTELRALRVVVEDMRADVERRMYVMAPEVRLIEEQLCEKARAKLKTEKAREKIRPGSDKKGTAFNWSSPDQLKNLLYDIYKLPVQHNKTGAVSTDESAIRRLIDVVEDGTPLRQLLKRLLEHRELTKVYGTYIGSSSKGLLSHVVFTDVGARIFPEYSQFTDTRRLCSAKPNAQNLPNSDLGAKVRRCLLPEPGNVFVYGDWAAVELRIAAHLSKDAGLVSMFLDDKEDPHCVTASRVFGRKITKNDKMERQVGKRMNFLTIYGGGPGRLRDDLLEQGVGEFTVRQCANWIDGWKEAYPDHIEWLFKLMDFVSKHGFTVAESGCVRRLPLLKSASGLDLRDFSNRTYLKNTIGDTEYKKFKHEENTLYNFNGQHLGSVILKAALVELFNKRFDIVTSTHDSIVIEVHASQAADKALELKSIMESCYKLVVPLVAEVKILGSLDESDIITP